MTTALPAQALSRRKRPRPRRVALLLLFGAAGASTVAPSCQNRFSACESEAPGCEEGGAGGLGGAPSSGGQSLEGGGEGGEMGGAAGFGGDVSELARRLGTPCTTAGAFACVEAASRYRLVCAQGVWTSAGQCLPTQRCTSEGGAVGTCQEALPECLDHEPGDWVCRGALRFRCGTDLLSEDEAEACAGGCVDGSCTECQPDPAAEGTCSGNGVQSCTPTGEWLTTPCPAEAPQCTGGACGLPPSCVDLAKTCGPAPAGGSGSEGCCASPVVIGGEFDRNNDPDLPAKISDFRLDRFEVTVGRFRKFRAAWDDGWRPEVGSGKHEHLNERKGLLDVTRSSGYEPGWSDTYPEHTDPMDANIDGIGADEVYATWTLAAGVNESRPINFVTRHEAYAFCIWDGGFLPSDAEWSYAVSGGDEQRTYPWGNTVPSADTKLAIYGCRFGAGGTCTDERNIAPVGITEGAGLFGQLDLVGNLNEWTLGATSVSECEDCTSVSLGLLGYLLDEPCRGRAFSDDLAVLTSDLCLPVSRPDGFRGPTIGVRCARAP